LLCAPVAASAQTYPTQQFDHIILHSPGSTGVGLSYDINISDYGAVGNGTTDDTTAFTNALNQCSTLKGGRIVLQPKQYLINTATLTVPESCAIVGQDFPTVADTNVDYSTRPYTLVLNPSYSIQLLARSGLRGVTVLSTVWKTAPTTTRQALTNLTNSTGIGVKMGPSRGSYLDHVFVLGFGTGVYTNGISQAYLNDVKFDDVIGLSMYNSGDINNLSAIEVWPFLTASQSWTTTSTNITGAADNGSGNIRLTVASSASYLTGDTGFASAVGGYAGANTQCTVTVVDATHVDCSNLKSLPTDTGAVTNGSNVLVLTADDPAINVGQTITDTTTAGNIPAATVTFRSGTYVYMSAAATGTGATDTLTFTNPAYTSGGTLQQDTNYRTGQGILFNQITATLCEQCFVYGHETGTELLDSTTVGLNNWANDNTPGDNDPLSIGLYIHGNTRGSRITGTYDVAGRPVVVNSSNTTYSNGVQIERIYQPPAGAATIAVYLGRADINNSGIQQVTGNPAVLLLNGITKAQFCSDVFISTIFYYQGDPAKLNTVLCPGTVYNSGTAFKFMIYGNTNTTVATGTNQYFVTGMTTNNTQARVILGQDTTYENLTCSSNVAPGGTESLTFSVANASTDTPLTCGFSGAGRSCSDVTHTAFLPAVAASFVFHVISSAAAAGAAVQCSVTAESK
jgi:hypothetical protein